MPTLLSALVALLLSLLYMGGILDPAGNLHQMPIAIVNEDQGPPLPGQRESLGAQATQSILSRTGDDVRWRRLSESQARDQIASGRLYGALVIPANFTARPHGHRRRRARPWRHRTHSSSRPSPAVTTRPCSNFATWWPEPAPPLTTKRSATSAKN